MYRSTLPPCSEHLKMFFLDQSFLVLSQLKTLYFLWNRGPLLCSCPKLNRLLLPFSKIRENRRAWSWTAWGLMFISPKLLWITCWFCSSSRYNNVVLQSLVMLFVKLLKPLLFPTKPVLLQGGWLKRKFIVFIMSQWLTFYNITVCKTVCTFANLMNQTILRFQSAFLSKYLPAQIWNIGDFY